MGDLSKDTDTDGDGEGGSVKMLALQWGGQFKHSAKIRVEMIIKLI